MGTGVKRILALLGAATLLGACVSSDETGGRAATAADPSATVPVPTAPGRPWTESTADTTSTSDPSTLPSFTPEQVAFFEGLARAEEARRQEQAVLDYLAAVAAEQERAQQAVDAYLAAVARQRAAEQQAIDDYLAAVAAQARDRFLG